MYMDQTYSKNIDQLFPCQCIVFFVALRPLRWNGKKSEAGQVELRMCHIFCHKFIQAWKHMFIILIVRFFPVSVICQRHAESWAPLWSGAQVAGQKTRQTKNFRGRAIVLGFNLYKFCLKTEFKIWFIFCYLAMHYTNFSNLLFSIKIIKHVFSYLVSHFTLLGQLFFSI